MKTLIAILFLAAGSAMAQEIKKDEVPQWWQDVMQECWTKSNYKEEAYYACVDREYAKYVGRVQLRQEIESETVGRMAVREL